MNLENKTNRRKTSQLLKDLTDRTNLEKGTIRIATDSGIKDIDKKEFLIKSNQKIINGGFPIADRLGKSELAKLTALMSTGTSRSKELAQSAEL